MRKISQYFLFLVCLFVACQQGEKVNQVDAGASVIPINIQKGGEYESLQQIRSQASALIDYRIEQEGDPYSMITYGYWYPEFVWNRGSMSKVDEYLGHWIKFEEDFSYSYGYYDKKAGSGRYHFRLDDKAMIMVDDNDEMEPKFWIANHNGEAMALVGQHDLGINNGMQIKMLPLDNRPSQG